MASTSANNDSKIKILSLKEKQWLFKKKIFSGFRLKMNNITKKEWEDYKEKVAKVEAERVKRMEEEEERKKARKDKVEKLIEKYKRERELYLEGLLKRIYPSLKDHLRRQREIREFKRNFWVQKPGEKEREYQKRVIEKVRRIEEIRKECENDEFE
uniref:Uncharacterized protein n=1 Tax=Strongyloides papillosus TaxID=174720 RepID=A0A0N5CC17_STREA